MEPTSSTYFLRKNKVIGLLDSLNNSQLEDIYRRIKNHLNIHFFKYQQLYVKTFIYDIFLQYKFSKSIYYALVNCILYNMNNKTDSIIIRSKKLKNFKQFFKKLKKT